VQDFDSIYLTPDGVGGCSAPGGFCGTTNAIIPISSFTLGGGSAFQPAGFNAVGGYGLFATVSATTIQTGTIANNTGFFTSVTLTLWGDPADQAAGSFDPITGLPTLSNTGAAPFKLATGSLANCGAPSPTCQNTLSSSGVVPTAAVTTTFVEDPLQTGFFVSPSASVTLNLLGSFTNNTSEIACFAATGFAAGCGGFLEGGVGTLPSGAPAGARFLLQVGRNVDGSIQPGGGSINFFATSVPEPGTLSLFGMGLLGLGFLSNRRNSKKSKA
jgi:hypothetical protein